MTDNYDYIFKILLIGDSGVGKSAIVERYVDNHFTETHLSTIGVDFKIKTISVDDKVVKFQIWDTAGQERFRSITTSYYRGAKGIFIVFDVTNRQSFVNVERWISEIKNYNINPVFIIANKCDLHHSRIITTEQGEALAKNYGYEYYEVSARQFVEKGNIPTIFENMAKILKGNSILLKEKPRISVPQQTQKNSRCCFT